MTISTKQNLRLAAKNLIYTMKTEPGNNLLTTMFFIQVSSHNREQRKRALETLMRLFHQDIGIANQLIPEQAGWKGSVTDFWYFMTGTVFAWYWMYWYLKEGTFYAGDTANMIPMMKNNGFGHDLQLELRFLCTIFRTLYPDVVAAQPEDWVSNIEKFIDGELPAYQAFPGMGQTQITAYLTDLLKLV